MYSFAKPGQCLNTPLSVELLNNGGRIRLHLLTEVINQQVPKYIHNCGREGLQTGHQLAMSTWEATEITEGVFILYFQKIWKNKWWLF